tara:strand:- start:199 stop:405 length:207 start_codon:yes stop_codon:yes gene_type:complete
MFTSQKDHGENEFAAKRKETMKSFVDSGVSEITAMLAPETFGEHRNCSWSKIIVLALMVITLVIMIFY